MDAMLTGLPRCTTVDLLLGLTRGSPEPMRIGLLSLVLLSACADLPQSSFTEDGAYGQPGLVPVGPLLAAADALESPVSGGLGSGGLVLANSLQSRAAALRARAARLRGPIIPSATKTRMRAGIAVPSRLR